MINEKSCGAVVYRIGERGLFFLVEHMVQGHVSIPKGHVEGNETEEETAIREIREETGLEVRLDTVFRHDVYYSPGEGIRKQVIFFAAETAGGDMRNQESFHNYSTSASALFLKRLLQCLNGFVSCFVQGFYIRFKSSFIKPAAYPALFAAWIA